MDVPIPGVVPLNGSNSGNGRPPSGRKKSTTDTAIYDIERVLQVLMRAHPGFQNLGTFDSGQNFHGYEPTTMHISTRAELASTELPVCQNFQVKGSRSSLAVGFASYDIKAMLDTGMPTARLKLIS